jgi:hypothetical protein
VRLEGLAQLKNPLTYNLIFTDESYFIMKIRTHRSVKLMEAICNMEMNIIFIIVRSQGAEKLSGSIYRIYMKSVNISYRMQRTKYISYNLCFTLFKYHIWQ